MSFFKSLLKFKRDSSEKVLPVDDYNFEQEVLDADLPVIVDFWAPWCVPCQVMSGLLSELAKEHAGQVKIVKLNIDQNRDVSRKFGIRGVPTVIFFRHGKKMDQIGGVVPKTVLKSRIEGMLAR